MYAKLSFSRKLIGSFCSFKSISDMYAKLIKTMLLHDSEAYINYNQLDRQVLTRMDFNALKEIEEYYSFQGFPITKKTFPFSKYLYNLVLSTVESIIPSSVSSEKVTFIMLSTLFSIETRNLLNKHNHNILEFVPYYSFCKRVILLKYLGNLLHKKFEEIREVEI